MISRKTHNDEGKELFVKLPYWLMDLPNWQRLKGSSVSVYLQLLRHYDGQNNGRVFLSVRDASALCGINKETAAAAFGQLEDEGLIENMRSYSASRTQRLAPEWWFTHLPCNVTGQFPKLVHKQDSGEAKIVIAPDAPREKRKKVVTRIRDMPRRPHAKIGDSSSFFMTPEPRPPVPAEVDPLDDGVW
jgi:hypothetical protein